MYFLALCAYAQDVIVKKSGEVLNVYNVEIATKYIYYTTNKSTDDIKKIIKDDVFSVKIGNGEMQMIGAKTKEQHKIQENTSEKEKLSEGLVERKVADNNAELIARYNKYHNGYTDKKPTNKVAKDGYAILGVTKESVLSNEDVEVQFYHRQSDDSYLYEYEIWVKNKTDRTLYIDLGNTFRIYNNGHTKVYYDGSQVSQNNGSGFGASVNIGLITGALGIGGIAGTLAGGVNVGGGKQESASKTYGNQRILAIPPMGKVALPPSYEIVGKKVVKDYDGMYIGYPKKYKGIIVKNSTVDFSEEKTIWKNQFMITYSMDSYFKSYSTIKFGLYLKQTLGDRFFYSSVKDFYKKLDGFDEYTLIGELYMDKKIQNVLDMKWSLGFIYY